MSDISYSEKLRDLSKEYYLHHIRFDEYRSQRKIIIDKIDEEFNGLKNKGIDSETESGDKVSILVKTIAFFKNRDVE